jgi:hypothetical protein
MRDSSSTSTMRDSSSASTMRDSSSTSAEPVPPLPWQRSSFCQGADSTCVTVVIRPAQVLLRDSKHPHGVVLTFSRGEWEAFLLGVHNGEFELPPC